MTTLTRDIERPAFLDRPATGQLSFGGAAVQERGTAPVHEPEADRVSLSERLQAERAAAVRGIGASSNAIVTRGGGATLDELLVGAWEGLSARRPVVCPVCSEQMQPRLGAAGGACGGCGSQVR